LAADTGGGGHDAILQTRLRQFEPGIADVEREGGKNVGARQNFRLRIWRRQSGLGLERVRQILVRLTSPEEKFPAGGFYRQQWESCRLRAGIFFGASQIGGPAI